jgi:hypothetical protein
VWCCFSGRELVVRPPPGSDWVVFCEVRCCGGGVPCMLQVWQSIGTFRIRCRIEDSSRVVNAAEERLRLGLQLYKVQRGIYLLDLVLLKGDAFTFLNSCARIIAELKVPAVAAGPAGAGGASAGAGMGTGAAVGAGGGTGGASASSSSMASGSVATFGSSTGGDSMGQRGPSGGAGSGPGVPQPPPLPSHGAPHHNPDAMDTST